MKVAFLDSIEEATYGGMEEWIRLVAVGLADRGHEAYVIGRASSQFLERLPSNNPRVYIVPMRIAGDFDPVTISRLRKILTDNEIDVLSVNFNKDVRLGGLAARLSGNTRVVWSMGLNITSDKPLHRWLTPKLIGSVIVPSNALRDEVVASGYIARDSIAVIPIGIPAVSYGGDRELSRRQVLSQFRLPEESIIAVTVGRFVDHKGHDYLVRAAASLVDQFPDLRFLFLGDGPNEMELRKQIGSLGLDTHFVFTGMLSEVSGILAGADVMIHPSVQEPFGIAILEGMRAGLPVVASRVGGIPEVVEEGTTALLCEPREPASLQQTVLSLLNDTPRMRAMGEAAQQRWDRLFRYDQMIDRVEAYFNILVREHVV